MFSGSIVAIVTPMQADGSIDYDAFVRLIKWHLTMQTDGIVVLGTTGESPTIHADERRRLIDLAVETVNDEVPIIVGTGANATDKAIELTQEAMEHGASAALLVTPYYNKPTQEGLYQHFKAIAEAVPLPQILYNVPSRTGCDLLPETAIRLSNFSNIVAIKEATGDLSRVDTFIEAECDLDLLTGDDGTALEFLMKGGKGVISVVANVVPQMFHDMCVAAVNGENLQAEQLDKQMRPLYKVLFAESNPIPIKWVMEKMGLIQGGIRLPLVKLSEKYHHDVRDAFKNTDLVLAE